MLARVQRSPERGRGEVGEEEAGAAVSGRELPVAWTSGDSPHQRRRRRRRTDTTQN